MKRSMYHRQGAYISILFIYWLHYTTSNLIFALSVKAPFRTCSIVTGANGYIGRAVVHELQQRTDNQDILCLVRQQRLQSEVEYWKNNSSNNGSINSVRVLPYDMLDGGASIQNALETTDPSVTRRVYHIASVFGPTTDHAQTALGNVKGTVDLVHTLARSGNCKLILTSSMAAVRGTGQIPRNGKFYTPEDWNTSSRLGSSWGESYQWSKTESERKAWELAEKRHVPMVALCPSFVFGPPLTNSASYALQLVLQWITGESPVQSRLFVDVRDCAKAHVEAGFRDYIEGRHRYIVSTDARLPSKKIAELIQKVCRNMKMLDAEKIHYDAVFTGGSIPIGEKEVESTQLLKQDLGISLRSAEDTIVNMATTILEMRKLSLI